MSDTTGYQIDEDVETLVNKIGRKCRGRIEILGRKGIEVVEFESKPRGGWQRTSLHAKVADEAFSVWLEFKKELPLLRKIREGLRG